jgi:hypothetical protein
MMTNRAASAGADLKRSLSIAGIKRRAGFYGSYGSHGSRGSQSACTSSLISDHSCPQKQCAISCPKGRAGSEDIGSCHNKAPPAPKQSFPAAYECSSHIDIPYPIIQSPRRCKC